MKEGWQKQTDAAYKYMYWQFLQICQDVTGIFGVGGWGGRQNDVYK